MECLAIMLLFVAFLLLDSPLLVDGGVCVLIGAKRRLGDRHTISGSITVTLNMGEH